MVIEKIKTKLGRNGTKNLIPLNKRSKEERTRIQTLGHIANKGSEAASLGQKLRFLREKGFNDKTKERLFELLKSPAFSRMDMVNYLEEVRKEKGLNTETKLKVLAAIRDVSKMIHGTKENDSKHAVLTLHLSTEEKEKEIERLLKD